MSHFDRRHVSGIKIVTWPITRYRYRCKLGNRGNRYRLGVLDKNVAQIVYLQQANTVYFIYSIFLNHTWFDIYFWTLRSKFFLLFFLLRDIFVSNCRLSDGYKHSGLIISSQHTLDIYASIVTRFALNFVLSALNFKLFTRR